MNNIVVPDKLLPFFHEKHRFKIAYGGRSGGKTDSFVLLLLIKLLQYPSNDPNKFIILVCRETMASIRDSSHATFARYITSAKLDKYFEVTRDRITCIHNGGYIVFKGIRRNPNELKSFDACKICWVEEASDVSKNSWDILIPTIRAKDSEIWISFNPKNLSDETYQRFIVNKVPNSLIVNINYYDNPFNSTDIIKEIRNWKLSRLKDYNHIFLGEVRQYSEAIIFKDKFEVKEFDTPRWDAIFQRTFFYGADWGFAQDPTCLIRCFILEEVLEVDNLKLNIRNLYIDWETGGVGIELPYIKEAFEKIPAVKHFFDGKIYYDVLQQPSNVKIYGDSARPDIISYLQRLGLPVYPCVKTIIEDGIDFLKGFYKIYIHPRCEETIKEFEKYSYKIDKNNNSILPEVDTKMRVDNYIDSVRYALSDLIVAGGGGMGTEADYMMMISKMKGY